MTEPVFLLSRSARSGPFARLASRVSTADEARTAFLQRRARWIAPERNSLELLWGLVEPKDTWHRLLVLHHVSPSRRELLNVLFRVVVAPDNGVKLLAGEELEEVLGAEHPEDYFIGGIVDEEDGTHHPLPRRPGPPRGPPVVVQTARAHAEAKLSRFRSD